MHPVSQRRGKPPAWNRGCCLAICVLHDESAFISRLVRSQAAIWFCRSDAGKNAESLPPVDATNRSGFLQGALVDGQADEISGGHPSHWAHLRRQATADDSRSFYSAGSLGASGNFANNLGLLSRLDDAPSRGLPGAPPNPSPFVPAEHGFASQGPHKDLCRLRLPSLKLWGRF